MANKTKRKSLVMCDNNNNNSNLRTTIYGKPTHIDRLYVAYSTNHLTTLLLTRQQLYTPSQDERDWFVTHLTI